MIRLFISFCLILLSNSTLAQKEGTFKISGIVFSANNGKGIPNGIVMISMTLKGSQCDSLGQFTISGLSQGQYKLSFSKEGYKQKDTLVSISDKDLINFTWIIYTECLNYNSEKALMDIKSKKPLILLQGGIAPVVYSTDSGFERKYKISFEDFGCAPFDEEECLVAYNQTIFDYLDKTYGNKWRKEIRKDAIGLKNK